MVAVAVSPLAQAGLAAGSEGESQGKRDSLQREAGRREGHEGIRKEGDRKAIVLIS